MSLNPFAERAPRPRGHCQPAEQALDAQQNAWRVEWPRIATFAWSTLTRKVTIRRVNIRDKRTIGEQIKSGFRLAAMILLTLAFIFLVLVSAASLIGQGKYIQPIHRILGGCVLAATSTVMFMTVRHWVKWFFGFLVYSILKVATSFVLGFTPSLPSIVRPRLIFLEFLVTLVIATALCTRYLNHAPNKLESAGLVGMVIALSFSIVCDSNVPILAGAAVLGLIQFVNGRRGFGVRRLFVGRRPN